MSLVSNIKDVLTHSSGQNQQAVFADALLKVSLLSLYDMATREEQLIMCC